MLSNNGFKILSDEEIAVIKLQNENKENLEKEIALYISNCVHRFNEERINKNEFEFEIIILTSMRRNNYVRDIVINKFDDILKKNGYYIYYSNKDDLKYNNVRITIIPINYKYSSKYCVIS